MISRERHFLFKFNFFFIHKNPRIAKLLLDREIWTLTKNFVKKNLNENHKHRKRMLNVIMLCVFLCEVWGGWLLCSILKGGCLKRSKRWVAGRRLTTTQNPNLSLHHTTTKLFFLLFRYQFCFILRLFSFAYFAWADKLFFFLLLLLFH